MAAPAAAEVPVLAYLVVGLLALLGWVVCRGLRGAWENTLGQMLKLMADALNYDKAFVHIHLGAPFTSIDHSVQNSLLVAAQKFEHTAGYFFHGAAVIQGWAARELMGLAKDTLAWAEWLQHSHLPKWVKALIYAAVPPALIYRLVKAAIAANLPHLGRVVITKTTHSVITRVVKIATATAGAVAIPGWVIRLPSRVGRLERDRANLWKRLRSLEKYSGATGAVALFVAALARLGLKWIRCKNVTKAGRAVCRTDGGLLDSLLLDSLLIAGSISVVVFAKELLAIEDEALTVMRRLVRELPS